MSSVRLLLSLAAENNWDLVHLDVKTAFLQSELNEEIYVRQPRGFEKHSPSRAPYACRLRRSLYGLCQSPASWFSTIHQFLLDIELKSCLADPCVYVKGSGTVILVLYVDDIIISGASSDAINKVKEKLMTKFDLSYLGDVTTFIGMDIVRDRSTGILLVRQCRYIHAILERFNMAHCNPSATPGDGTTTYYQELVGSLIYLVSCTRPDIAYAVMQLSRFQNKPSTAQLTAGKRVMRYLKGTQDLPLRYGAGKGELSGFADASFASDPYTNRSTSGYVFTMSGAAITWSSKMQPIVALSTMEAEFISLAYAAQEAVYLGNFFEELGFPEYKTITMYEDNMGAL
ncbi:unnamed protein product [Discosporangium mesarthrocarpum]